jgi:hypothetical protein
VTLAHDRPTEANAGSDDTDPLVRIAGCAADRAWRDDVALELWIDAAWTPVAIRLEGVLDETTGVTLLRVVGDLLAEGRLDFTLDTRALRITSLGTAVMTGVGRQIRGSGGHLQWDGAAA